MATLETTIGRHIDDGTIPGAVAVVARGDRVESVAMGARDLAGTASMSPDSIFRLASVTKPITAAAVLILIDDGRIALTDAIDPWLPELARPMVVRTPTSPLDDVVPATRPITVLDLLTSQAGWGFGSDFSLPAVQALFPVRRDGREIQSFPAIDEWLAELAQVPLIYQPGASWLYDTSSALQGALVARVSGQALPDFLADRIFAPLGMVDTDFVVPPAKQRRFTSFYTLAPSGDLALADGPDGQWSTDPAFPLGSGGLAATAGDWLAFARMLLADGVAPDGRTVLSADSVALMTTDHTTPAHREIGALFLEGQGWGMGGSVDIAATDPWNVPGRYGWVGATGTTAHIVPDTGAIAILFTQVAADDPESPVWMRDFWRYAATWQ